MKYEETYEDSKSRYLSVNSFHTRRADTSGSPNVTQYSVSVCVRQLMDEVKHNIMN